MGNIHATMVRCFPMTKRVQSSSWRRQWEATAGGRSNGEVITASKDNVSCQGLSDAKVLILRTHRCCRGCCAPSPEVAPPSPAITDAAAAQGIDRCPFCQNLVRNTIHRAERAGTYLTTVLVLLRSCHKTIASQRNYYTCWTRDRIPRWL